ncbi:MAG TPA: hypothetical protein VLC52_12365 [Anaerolineae bacterium]|nr:hypothetical protein [Anaerolineae bacterium]
MVKRSEERFAGYECTRLSNGALALWVTREVGPRIIGLAPAGEGNLLAELPEFRVQFPSMPVFSFRGGHRLWYGPEDARRTYQPDDAPVAVEAVEGGVRAVQPVEAETGIQKSMTIVLAGDEPHVVIDHALENRGTEPVALAPWAITQLRPGGVAILPQATGPVDEHGLLPNRHLVLWPYTRLDAPHVTWGEGLLLLDTAQVTGPFKVGFPNPAGWLAYAVGETLFVKHAPYHPGAEYLDQGSSSECYCNPRFLELETLGPYTRLAPGEVVEHREVWDVYTGTDVPRKETEAQALVEKLGIGQ